MTSNIQGSMPEAFDRAIATVRISEDEHRFVVPDGWQQGRGAFGGLVLGAMMQVMESREPDGERVARTFTGDICGPAVPVESRIVSRVLRRGNNQTNLAATFEQAGAVVAHATCTLSRARSVGAPPRFSFDPPVQPPYELATVAGVTQREAPPFAKHFEFRPTGPLPFAGGAEAVVLGWVKEAVALPAVTAAALIARLDAHWPAIFSVERAPRSLATVSFMAEILCDPRTLDPQKPMFYRGRIVAESGGYVVELRELWDGDRVIALNQQSIALLA